MSAMMNGSTSAGSNPAALTKFQKESRYNKCMSKYVPKMLNVVEVKALVAEGKFPYYHPCAGCGKACSTPTKEFWQKRMKEFGTVEVLYSEFKCRDCRKSKKEIRKERASALYSPASGASVSTLGRKPGDYVKVPDGCVGVSIWEGGKFLGTTFQKVFAEGTSI